MKKPEYEVPASEVNNMSSEDPTKQLRGKSLEERVEELERKFAERGYDTRPIFEAHEKRIAQLELTIEQLKGGGNSPLTFAYGLYWATNDGTPFCPQCWEGKPHEERHLQQQRHEGEYWCSNCRLFFRDQRYPENNGPADLQLYPRAARHRPR